ncbi:MAG: germination protein Ger(x)C family [Symbiobacteriaceae bacterium]|jgi:Ger(x)C family germination protein|nr:germination protein Ger(x)C family [Symbiobacteriaceae bacterium]
MERRRGLVGVAWLLAAVLLVVTGCWDARPIEQRAFVVMIGFDWDPEAQYRVTLQVQRAGYEAQGSGRQRAAPMAQIVVSEGQTPRKALEHARDRLARELDTTFLELTVIGRTLAERNLDELDWVVRTFRVPVSGYVAVAPADAESVVRGKAPGYGIPAQFAFFGQMGGVFTRSAAIVSGPMWMMFNRNFFTPLEDNFAPVLGLQGEDLDWQGLAVFKEHRLVGMLSETDAAHFNLLSGSRAEMVVGAKVPGREGAQATLYLQTVSVRRKVVWQGDRPVIQVRAVARGDLQELIGMRLWSPADEEAVEGALAGALATRIKGLIARLQELESDPLGFGELARQAAPYRREVQSGEAWREVYRDAPVDVLVTVRMVAPGYMK